MHFRAVCLFILGLLAVVSQAAPGVPKKANRPAEDLSKLSIITVDFDLPVGHVEGDPIISRRRLVHFFDVYHPYIVIKKPTVQIISNDDRWPSAAANMITMRWYVSNRQHPNEPSTWTPSTVESDDCEWD
ncbi:hypothetical protein F5051DRAFT_80493 [Lentinula edodes]|nr:hypothetical protein F5051DRAFT_80493 [Lentinula edodes]